MKVTNPHNEPENKIYIESDVLNLIKEDNLIDTIFSSFWGIADDDQFVSLCVRLHNDGVFNLLSITDHPRINDFNGHAFFSGQHFYCEAIPLLSATTKNIMRCVRALVKMGGQDLVANQPNAAFQKWCERDLTRAHEIITNAKSGDYDAIHFLTFALVASDSIEDAISFTSEDNNEIKFSGIAALGRMKFESPAAANQALNALLVAVSRNKNGIVHSNALISTYAIIASKFTDLTANVDQITEIVCRNPEPETQLRIAEVLWTSTPLVSRENRLIMFDALKEVNPEHTRIVEIIDHGLCATLGTTEYQEAINLALSLMTRVENSIDPKFFKHFGRKMFSDHSEMFATTFLGCLLSGDSQKCKWVTEVFSSHDEVSLKLGSALAASNFTPTQLEFICRKAIGYFFMQPTLACSIILDVLKVTDKKSALKIRNYLFDPLLLNYGGSVTDYLTTKANEKIIGVHVKFALKSGEKYLADLRSVGNCNELLPSEHERQIERHRFHDTMNAAHKEAQKKSVFHDIIRHSTILYGNKTVTYITDHQNVTRPIETELHSHGVSMEMPRTEIVDPFGLDFMLRVFRSEKFKL
jgi:hypothetical protein